MASAVGLAELFAGEDLQPVFAGESEADQTRGVGGWDADADFHHHFIHICGCRPGPIAGSGWTSQAILCSAWLLRRIRCNPSRLKALTKGLSSLEYYFATVL